MAGSLVVCPSDTQRPDITGEDVHTQNDRRYSAGRSVYLDSLTHSVQPPGAKKEGHTEQKNTSNR